MNHVSDWMLSVHWRQKPNETEDTWIARCKKLAGEYWRVKRNRGNPILRPQKIKVQQPLDFDFNKCVDYVLKKTDEIPVMPIVQEIRHEILYPDEVPLEKYKTQAIRNNQYFSLHDKAGTIASSHWICPLCCTDKGFMMRVLAPTYEKEGGEHPHLKIIPEGFLDKGGVCAKCICLPMRTIDKIDKKGKEENLRTGY